MPLINCNYKHCNFSASFIQAPHRITHLTVIHSPDLRGQKQVDGTVLSGDGRMNGSWLLISPSGGRHSTALSFCRKFTFSTANKQEFDLIRSDFDDTCEEIGLRRVYCR